MAESINPFQAEREVQPEADNQNSSLNVDLKDQRIMAWWAQKVLEDLRYLLERNLPEPPSAE